MIWNNVRDLNWARNYGAAKKYWEENGNLDIPSLYITQEGIPLGQWLCQLRNWERSGAQSKYLTTERKQALDEIGMIWNKLDYLWEKNYSEACTYYREHHNLKVPLDYVTANGIRLGAWLYRLRQLRSGKGRGAPPTKDQIVRLDALGMVWDIRSDSKWESFYQAAKAYAKENRTLSVPVAYTTESGLRLGSWIQRQRRIRREGKLLREREEKLNAIGMQWEAQNSWQKHFEVVQRYYKEHGTLAIPQNLVIEGIWIGKWIAQQKKLYELGEKLTEEQRKLLADLPLKEVGNIKRGRKIG